MTPDEIQAALRDALVSQSELARLLDCSKSVVSSVIKGKSRSPRVEAAIAAALGTEPRNIWPAWYMPSGRRIRRLRRLAPQAVIAAIQTSLQRLKAAA